jgi:beta-lactamase superfamily II metal-dependent hydrolase
VIKLHVVQAEYGDCFILESKSGKDSVKILIDGGPYQTFEKHLKPTIQKILLNDKFDLMVLSHIDTDHIIGLLDLLDEIKNQREDGKKELAKVEKIWHNSFNDLFEFNEEPKKLVGNIFSAKNMVPGSSIGESLVMKGFQQGTDLTKLAKMLKIPINPDFDRIIVVSDKIRSVRLKNIGIVLLGPSKKNVDKLRKEWNKWSSKKKNIDGTLIALLELVDKSVPNLASITFLAKIKNRKILFTGDGLGYDIVDILSKNHMLDKNGKFHVDVLKVPHHGSDRNSSPEFFDTINANYYIISANGRDDNPSFNTLKWILESAKTSSKPRKIIMTNMTPNFKKVLQEYDKNKYNYESIILKNNSHLMTIELK